MLSYEICLYLTRNARVVLETALLGPARGGAEHLAHLSRGLGAMVSTSVLGTLIFQVAASEMTAVREASLASPAPASM